MNILLYKEDNLRISGDFENKNFINVCSVGYNSLAIDLFPTFHYIEIRKKGNQVRVFTFIKKSHKKEYDFEWWEDAEVVYALNDTTNKG
jgi:hypothetical protein